MKWIGIKFAINVIRAENPNKTIHIIRIPPSQLNILIGPNSPLVVLNSISVKFWVQFISNISVFFFRIFFLLVFDFSITLLLIFEVIKQIKFYGLCMEVVNLRMKNLLRKKKGSATYVLLPFSFSLTDAFQTNIFCWLNDILIKRKVFLESWDREIWWKTFNVGIFIISWSQF